MERIPTEQGAFLCDGRCVVGFSGSMNRERLVFPDGTEKIGLYYHFPFHQTPDPYKIAGGIFRGAQIRGELCFPDSLKFVGAHTFIDSAIGRITLPPSLCGISVGAFLKCRIHTLTIPEAFPRRYIRYGYNETEEQGVVELGGRQFKASCIEQLYVPSSYPQDCIDALFAEAQIRHVIRY